MESIGEQLKRYRARAGLTQDSLGLLIGVSGPQVAHVERGKRNLSESVALRAADELRLSPEERQDFLGARSSAAHAAPEASQTILSNPLLQKIRVDLDAAEAWGKDQTYRLSVLRRLYDLEEHAFYDEMIEDLIRSAEADGGAEMVVTRVQDLVDDFIAAREQHFAESYDPADFLEHAAHDDEDGALDGRTETPVEETPEV